MCKQCKIYDMENNTYHGGILLDNGSVICGCCGGIIEADEIEVPWNKNPNEYKSHIIIDVYDNWIDLTNEICGED